MRALAVSPGLTHALLCICFAFSLTRVQWQLEGGPKLQKRLELHDEVLANRAITPYQQHMFVISHVAQWMHDHLGMKMAVAFEIIHGLSYLFVLLATWFLLSSQDFSPRGVRTGLLAVVAYAGILLQYSAVQPADGFAAGLFAINLAVAASNWSGSTVAVAALAGFFSLKHVLIGPVLAIHYALQQRWQMLLIAGTACAAATVGPICYHLVLGSRPNEGVVPVAEWLYVLAKATIYHFAFAAAPLVCLWQQRFRVGSILLAGVAFYPMLIGAYLLQLKFIYELRSFWMVVPVFAALLAGWDREVPESAKVAAVSEQAGHRGS
jgi:hypothetical protein